MRCHKCIFCFSFFNSVGISSRNKLLFPIRCDLVSFTWSKWRKNLHRVQKTSFTSALLPQTKGNIGLLLIILSLCAAFDKFKAWESDSWYLPGWSSGEASSPWSFMSKLLGTSQNNSQVCAQDYQGLQVWLLHVFALQWLFISKARLPFDRA